MLFKPTRKSLAIAALLVLASACQSPDEAAPLPVAAPTATVAAGEPERALNEASPAASQPRAIRKLSPWPTQKRFLRQGRSSRGTHAGSGNDPFRGTVRPYRYGDDPVSEPLSRATLAEGQLTRPQVGVVYQF